jgi:hypothetical protein
MIPPDPFDSEFAELLARLILAFVLVMIAIGLFFGCAHRPEPRREECHVLRVDQITESMGDGESAAVREKWLAWCGEGRYVVFSSSVVAGQRVRFTEYQEDNELQIYGQVEGPK